jgi:hypothetical protein
LAHAAVIDIGVYHLLTPYAYDRPASGTHLSNIACPQFLQSVQESLVFQIIHSTVRLMPNF